MPFPHRRPSYQLSHEISAEGKWPAYQLSHEISRKGKMDSIATFEKNFAKLVSRPTSNRRTTDCACNRHLSLQLVASGLDPLHTYFSMPSGYAFGNYTCPHSPLSWYSSLVGGGRRSRRADRQYSLDSPLREQACGRGSDLLSPQRIWGHLLAGVIS